MTLRNFILMHGRCRCDHDTPLNTCIRYVGSRNREDCRGYLLRDYLGRDSCCGNGRKHVTLMVQVKVGASVRLLELFCFLYHTRPDGNHLNFFLRLQLASTLSSLDAGIAVFFQHCERSVAELERQAGGLRLLRTDDRRLLR